MAQDDIQKSVQGIKDPSTKKKAYYTAQREDAESKADKGDRSAAALAGKINTKAGGKRTDFFLPENAQQKKATWYNDQAKFGRGGAMANAITNRVGEIFQPGDTEIGSAIGGALKGIGGLAKNAVSRFFPKTSEEAASAVGKRQNLGVTRPVSKATKELPSKKSLPGSKTSESSKVYEIKGGGTTKPSVSGSSRKALTDKSKASSLPKKDLSNMKIKSEAPKPKKEGLQSSARFNQQAAKQNPRSRAMRNNEALGKPGSVKKGKYVSAKLRPAVEAREGESIPQQDYKYRSKKSPTKKYNTVKSAGKVAGTTGAAAYGSKKILDK